ncbi:hypothetical protein REPUB_Repub16aG0117700 [Reevesia pubescens]
MKGLRISILLLACLVASAAAQSDSSVNAFWTDYNVTNNNWDYNAADVFCAAVDGDKPLEWRSQFGWTGYCGPNQGLAACGKCLSVTNTRTGAKEKVRIVDTCGTGPLELDLEKAFKPIDTDGKGMEQGHLVVDYEFVDCEPPVPPPPPPGPGEENVKAYWTDDYKVKQNNWDLNAAKVYCADVDSAKPLEWRSKYGWIAFCGKVGSIDKSACGKCLKNWTPAYINETAFDQIDTDGSGVKEGYLMVDYEYVDCGDSNTVLVYSE